MTDKFLEQMVEDSRYIREGLKHGRFRLIMWDDFPWPPEPCIIGETDSLETAKAHADRFADTFQSADVINDQGEIVYSTKPRRVKKGDL
jgi:hypothetical protein